MPWPTGQICRINGGYTYGCGTHGGPDFETNYFALDFDMDIGDAISAVAPGTVVTAYAGGGGTTGNYIEIDHGGGYRSRYLHLEDVDVGQGASVARSQPIGESGNTGILTTGPHLHFDYKLNGGAAKPEPLSGVWNFEQWGLSGTGEEECDVNNGPSPYWDIDEFDNVSEDYFGTNSSDDCANTTNIGDEPGLDAWPLDFNDDKRHNISDVVLFGPHFNQPADTPERRRFNLDEMGFVNLGDIVFAGYGFNRMCPY